MTSCPNQTMNAKKCTCTYNCERRGRCCECVEYHRSLGGIPGCFFTAQGEKTWDRSASMFIRDRGTSAR